MSRVRPFADGDRPLLEDIYRECRAEAEWLPLASRVCSDFSREIEGESILVAIDCNGDPAGFVSVWEPDRFIHHLYVRADARRQGVAMTLIQALELPKPWRLKCLRANVAATAFYRAQGWVEVSSGVSEEGSYSVLEKT